MFSGEKEEMIFKNKKGNAQGVIFIAVAIFVLAVGLFVIYYMANQSYDKMIQNPVINSSSKTVDVLNAGKAMTNKIDYLIFAFFVGSILSILITSYFIGGNPLFLFIYFLITLIGVVVAIVLSYIWDLVSTSSIFGATVASFPLTNHIMTYLPYYTAVLGISGMILMFAKPYIDQPGGY